MSETGEDRAYYAAAEAAFVRRRGTPFLLSPRDFALLREWRALGVPLEAVEAGIDEAFSRREERSAVGRVNSLSYCRDAVLEAWERRAETSRGKRRPRAGLRRRMRRRPFELSATGLEALARAAGGPRRPARVGAAVPRAARRSLERRPKRSRIRSPASIAASRARSPRRCLSLSGGTSTPRSRAFSRGPATAWTPSLSKRRPAR